MTSDGPFGGETARRSQGCWTCKQRKIGCDRGHPACNNCLRTGRQCLGYGIRLAWPDKPDGRRRRNQLPEQTIAFAGAQADHYGQLFLNVTYSDLEVARLGRKAEIRSLMRLANRPPKSIPFLPDVTDGEAVLFEYYETQLTRMISTINVNNGFREYLLPMAFFDSSAASDGLRNAILALSAFHRKGSEAARGYKAAALRSLATSLEMPSKAVTETQLATSMMLCVYNVFDESEGNWELHLQGAKNILYQLAHIEGGYVTYCFLYTWFLYHEILGGFVEPERHGPEGPASLQISRDSDFDTSVIIGSLGCSVEVMEIISYVNGLRAIEQQEKSSPISQEESMRRREEWNAMNHKLANLEQRVDPMLEPQLQPTEHSKILATAELYRIATLLYLQRTSTSSEVQDLRSMCLEQAFELLRRLKPCTSPWPLFVIACETMNDEQRIEILQALDHMDSTRGIGNLLVLRNIIETFWKQQDLMADTGRPTQPKWWDVIDLNTAAPWFI